jgi:hypothetical protein
MNSSSLVSSLRTITAAALCTTMIGCGIADDQVADTASSSFVTRLAALDHDLEHGATGPQVRALHEYLVSFGYFPNEHLPRSYPAWRPIVSRLPDNMDVFDEQTLMALRRFQANAGLPATGTVDARTRSVLKQSRCGVPDGIAPLDPHNKFAYLGSKWGATLNDKINITWRVINSDDLTMVDARNAVRSAFDRWQMESSRTFTELTSGTADIQVSFDVIRNPDGTAEGRGGILAAAASPANGGDVIFDSSEIWSVANPSPSGAIDFETIALHELGHALGLHHSAFREAAMFPFAGALDRALDLDDAVGISSIYDMPVTLPGAAKDISAGTNESIWVIGNATNDGAIFKFNGTNWTPVDGYGVRIAVAPTGRPWVVNSSGSIYRHTTGTPTIGSWELMPALPFGARDIAVGSDGSVWAIDRVFSADGFIYKFDGAAWQSQGDGYAARIAVGPTGIPWVVNSSGNTFRRTTSDWASGSWESLPNPGTARVLDIGISDGIYAWVLSRTNGPLPLIQLSVWNEQTRILDTEGVEVAPARFEWRTTQTWTDFGTGPTSISVGPGATPFITATDGRIVTVIR